MKANVLLVFLSFLWAGVTAQPEAVSLPFVEEGKSWDVTFMTVMNSQSYKSNYIIEGDTIMQGRQYKKMLAKKEGTNSYQYIYALREDGGKVYSIYSSGTPADETLWYDFNVSEGDEIENKVYHSLLHITGTDYIYVNGIKRKRIHINVTRKGLSIGLTGVWVEGIGSNLAPDSPEGWGRDGGGAYMDQCSVDGKILFTYSDFAAPAFASGQDYHPFVMEGKEWHEKDSSEMVEYGHTYAISGDTVINGESYKKLYHTVTLSPRGDAGGVPETEAVTYGPSVMAWLQEHDGKVYMLNSYGQKGILYDFTLSEGDTAFENEHYTQVVTKVDTVLVNGMKLRRLQLKESSKEYDFVEPSIGYWVEGIGSNYGLECPHGWELKSSVRMQECLEGGRPVFTLSDFHAPAWRGEGMSKCATPAIAFAEGKLVFSCATPGAVCTYKIKGADGASGIGGEATLGLLCEICVCASAEGYADSDVATATIGWRDGRPVMEGFSSIDMGDGTPSCDVNGDGIVDVADIATIISAMAKTGR